MTRKKFYYEVITNRIFLYKQRQIDVIYFPAEAFMKFHLILNEGHFQTFVVQIPFKYFLTPPIIHVKYCFCFEARVPFINFS